MAEDSESAASQQSLELDDQDTCGIDGDNEEENEHMQGWVLFTPPEVVGVGGSLIPINNANVTL